MQGVQTLPCLVLTEYLTFWPCEFNIKMFLFQGESNSRKGGRRRCRKGDTLIQTSWMMNLS
jgi:hypothetical protein